MEFPDPDALRSALAVQKASPMGSIPAERVSKKLTACTVKGEAASGSDEPSSLQSANFHPAALKGVSLLIAHPNFKIFLIPISI
jgi:hypothetical protein